jgi:hygromycin-B 4-O-kinase
VEKLKYEKPPINKDEMNEIIQKEFDGFPEGLTLLPGGEIASTFFFSFDGKEYFIQFNQPNMSFGSRIELEFHNQLKKLNVPVRSIVTQDNYKDLHYSISEKVQGRQLQELDEYSIKEMLPQVYKTSLAISQLDISANSGYGWLDKNNNGMSASWTGHLNCVMAEEDNDLFYGKWHVLFEKTFLDRKIYEKYFGKMTDLYNHLPKTRCFQHGNFSLANILIDNDKISAVLDWQDSRYGDFIYDLNYFAFWLPFEFRQYILQDFKDYYEAAFEKLEHYQERIRCYSYFIGLDSLRFFAKSDKKDAYNFVLNILENI